MFSAGRDKLFAWIAHVGTTRSLAIVCVTTILLVLAGMTLPNLRVSTSRHGLVEDENPYQQRLNKFHEKFGDPTSPIFFVISGGDADDRRQIVDDLVAEFKKKPELDGRVIARMGPHQLAKALLLQDPEVTETIRTLVPTDTNLTTFVEGGLPAYLDAINARLGHLAAGLQMRMMMPFGGGIGTDQVNSILDRLSSLALTTDAFLAGENPWAHMELRDTGRQSMDAIDSAGYVVGQGNEYLLVTVFPEFEGDEVEQLEPMVSYLRGVRDDVLKRYSGTQVNVRLTGVPALAVDELAIVEKGLYQSGVATGLGVLLLFLFSFRSFRQSVLAAIPLVVGIILTLSFVQLVYGRLNLITSSFISVLLGLGIDFPVHLLSRYNEFRRQSVSIVDSLRESLMRTGPGIVTGALTTVLAFMTTATTEFTAFAELGIITSVGLVIMLVATLLVVPAFTQKLQRSRDVTPPELPGTDFLTFLVRSTPRFLVTTGVALAFLGALALGDIKFNYRYFDFLPQETESAQALLLLEDDLSMGPTFANVSTESVESARIMADRIRALPSVATVQSATDLLPPLTAESLGALRRFYDEFPATPDFKVIASKGLAPDSLVTQLGVMKTQVTAIENIFKLTGQSLQSTEGARASVEKLEKRLGEMGETARPKLDQASVAIGDIIRRAWTTAKNVVDRQAYLPEDIPRVLKNRFVSKNEDALALYVYPKGNIWDRNFAETFARELENVDPNVSGFAITLHAHSSMILGGFKRAALLAGVLICTLLWLDFRNKERAILALVPALFGWCWMIGLMSIFDISFNVANIVALPLVLGIGIDAGVHMVHRSWEGGKGESGKASVEDLVKGTGSAVMLASITTGVGFAGLMIADYGGMKSLGLVMVLGISCSLLACLLILPAILILAKRAE